MSKIPIIIISFNRLTWLTDTIKHVQRIGGIPIIFDNASTYKPLVERLENISKKPKWTSFLSITSSTSVSPIEMAAGHSFLDMDQMVIHSTRNLGAFGPWEKIYFGKSIVDGLRERFGGEYYGATDPDLDLSALPDDALTMMKIGLELNPEIRKCGVSLESPSPDYPFAKMVMENERAHWVSPGFHISRSENIIHYWKAGIDTTLHLARYDRPVEPWTGYKCLRVGPPYRVRHLPWHQKVEDFTEEDMYYHKHSLTQSQGGFTYWTEEMQKYLHTRGKL